MSPAMTNAVITLTSEAESVMATLGDLLDRESAAVESSDFTAFRAVQSDKFAMLTRYRSLMETLQRQGGILTQADETLRDRLKQAAKKFQDSTARNERALETGAASMQRILDRIVKCARDTVHANRQTYNKKGASSISAQTPVSIQIDEVL